MSRFSSPTLIFRIAGRPPSQGGRGGGVGGVRAMGRNVIATKSKKEKYLGYNANKKLNLAEYTNLIRLIAKTAMVEQNWEITEEPLYMVITFYVNYEKMQKKSIVKDIYASDVAPKRTPKLHTASKIFIKALENVVYKNQLQIAGLLVLKRYSPVDECTDILIGKPSNYKELINDIRNN